MQPQEYSCANSASRDWHLRNKNTCVMKKVAILTTLGILSSPCYAALVLTDALNVQQGSQPVIASSADIITEVGQALDDTYNGQITITWTMNYDALDGGSASNTFAFIQFKSASNSDLTGIGNYWAGTQYSTWNEGGTGGDINRHDSGTVININTPQEFTLVINFNAGADDTATLSGAGFSNTILNAGDYSFDSIVARGGNNSTQFDITNGSLTAVPESSSTGLLGIAGIALIMRRRR